MILELDCGNSFIKWRLLDKSAQMVICGGVVSSAEDLLEAVQQSTSRLLGCRLVSVRSDEETRALICVIEAAFAVNCVCAQPAEQLGGVYNGYAEYERLGLDRWLAVVGAYDLARGACLVLDLGTAVTSDFVAPQGQHLGGFICPGVPLMLSQLRTHTRRIRYNHDAAEQALDCLAPGRSTAEAVERGCSLMLQGFVKTQLELARAYWGNEFTVFLTGGDASQVEDLVPDARVLSDLVFVGLAIACPLS